MPDRDYKEFRIISRGQKTRTKEWPEPMVQSQQLSSGSLGTGDSALGEATRLGDRPGKTIVHPGLPWASPQGSHRTESVSTCKAVCVWVRSHLVALTVPQKHYKCLLFLVVQQVWHHLLMTASQFTFRKPSFFHFLVPEKDIQPRPGQSGSGVSSGIGVGSKMD